jgi:hypothetical protein
MTADEYDTGGMTSPTDRIRSGDGPVVGGETGNGFAPVPSERFDADFETADREALGGSGIAGETPSSTDIEELRHV